MSIQGELKQVARQLADSAKVRLARIEEEIAEIEERKAQLLSEREAVRNAAERALNFLPMRGIDYQCPRCWINHKTRAMMEPILSQKPKEDVLRCIQCGFEYNVT
jgi:hypothetical protein